MSNLVSCSDYPMSIREEVITTYTFKFFYENNSYQEFEHIIKVEYSIAGMAFTVMENEILQHHYPTGRDMHLFARDASYTASGKNVKSISVTKED